MRALVLFVPSFLFGCVPDTVKLDGDDTGVGPDETDTDIDTDTDTDTDTVVDGAISVAPDAITFPTLFVGQSAAENIQVTNVGEGPVAVTLTVVGGWSTAYTLSSYTASPAPGATSEHTLTLTPTAWGDHSVSVIVEDSASGGRVELQVLASVQEDADGDGHGSSQSGGDDCEDTDPTIHPGAPDTWYDGVDSDCTGNDDYDQDGDGAWPVEFGGDDCDDTNASIYLGAPDTWYDGVDSDCAGNDDYDQDGDAWVSDEYTGLPTTGVDGSGALPSGDCLDTDASIHPGAPDTWYDGVDSDCAGNDDDDQDGDGVTVATDCDDTDASVRPGATETWYDGVDADCSGGSDYDQDLDGADYPTDCNDTDPSVLGPVDEVLDGLDNDCDGTTDDISVTDAATGVLYGSVTDGALGDKGTMAMSGDLTGDGRPDLVVTATESSGYAYVISGGTAATAAGVVTDYDTATLTGESVYYAIRWVNGPFEDVTGDGTADLAIGGAYDSAYYTYGRSYVMEGGSSLSGSVSTSGYYAQLRGDSEYDYTVMSAMGDVDGDGQADVVAGSPYDHLSYTYVTGNVAVFLGSELVDSVYDLGDAQDQIHGESSYSYLGYTLTIGEVTGDGYADIIAGAPGHDSGSSADQGAVFVFAGNASASWSDQAEDAAAAWFTGVSYRDEIGEDPLPHPGDVDGDGQLDVGVPSESEGGVWIFLGGSSLSGEYTTSDADWSFTGTVGDFGAMLIMDSDLDGDGADDIVIGADGYDSATSNAGAVFIFTGGGWSTGVTSSSASASIWGTTRDYYLGSGGAGGQDLTGDGREDIVIGEASSDAATSNGGTAWIVPGW